MRSMLKSRWVLVGSLVVLPLLLMAPDAMAQAVDPGCGSTIMTSCSSTETFTAMDQWLGGGPTAPDCPAYINEDWGHELGDGHGVSHININGAGDEWLTSTWTGAATITFYSPANVDIALDGDGNVVSATPTGPPDEVLTGHNTTWFGASFNKNNSEFSFTFSFHGIDQQGHAVRVNGEQHAVWTPGSDPEGPPTFTHATFSCG